MPNISVKFFIKGKTHVVEIEDDLTVKEVKHKLKQEVGTDENSRFIFSGKMLQDDLPIVEYGIQKNSVIHVAAPKLDGNGNVELQVGGGGNNGNDGQINDLGQQVISLQQLSAEQRFQSFEMEMTLPWIKYFFIHVVTFGLGVTMAIMGNGWTCDTPLRFWNQMGAVLFIWYTLAHLIMSMHVRRNNNQARRRTLARKWGVFSTILFPVMIVWMILGCIWVFSTNTETCQDPLYTWSFAYVVTILGLIGLACCCTITGVFCVAMAHPGVR